VLETKYYDILEVKPEASEEDSAPPWTSST